MRKKLLCSMLMLFSVFLLGGLFSSTAFAAAVTYENIPIGETGNELNYTLTADAEASTYTATVCVPKTVSGEITIPATVDYEIPGSGESHTYAVTTITKGGANSTVQNITISNGITTISGEAFMGFTALKAVSFPATIIDISSSAFSGCSALENVDLSATSLTTVPSNCFASCTALSEVTLPTSITEIGASAFSGCAGLADLNLTELTSLTTIGSRAFEGCSTLATVDLSGTSLTTVSAYCFYDCEALSAVKLPTSIAVVNEFAFKNCAGLININLTELTSLTTIGSDAFKGCSKLASVDLSATSLTTVAKYCFNGCTALSEVKLPTSISEIGYSAFGNCTALERINLTDLTSLSTVDSEAFSFCSRLRYSRLTGAAASDYEFVLPASVLQVGISAFANTDLRSVDLSALSGHSVLNSNMFTGSSLKTILLPTGLSEGLCELFAMTPALRDITFANDEADNYKVVDGVVFSKDGATLLYYPAGKTDTEYAVPSGITVIGDGAFNASKLKSITLPDGLVSIGGYAFMYCDLLKTVTLPSSVTSIGYGAFGYCQSLLSIDCSACQELTVSAYCVAGSLSLRTVKLPPVIDNISPKALMGCDSVALYWKSDTPVAYLFAGYDSPVVVVSHDVGTVPSLFGAYSVVCYPDTARIAWDVSDPEMSSVLVPYHVENSEFTKLPLRISLDIGAFPRSDILLFVKCLHGLKIAGYEVVNGDEILEAGYPFVAYEDLPGGTTSDSLTKKVILTRTTYALKYDGDCVSQFTGETITRPTPSNPEILTLDSVTDDTVTLKIYYGTNNPQDYRVRVHDEVLVADSNEDGVYTYTVQVNEPITRVYIECPYDVAGNGVFTNTGSGIYVYNRKWRV